jgi:hypothetical protein
MHNPTIKIVTMLFYSEIIFQIVNTQSVIQDITWFLLYHNI